MGAWRGWMVDRKIRETKQIVTGQLVEVHLSPLSRSHHDGEAVRNTDVIVSTRRSQGGSALAETVPQDA